MGQRRMFAYFHGYLILVGLAIENALKGLLIGDNPSLVSPAGVSKTILGRGGHGIRRGMDQYVTLTGEESEVVTRLEEFLVWAAKYPVPISVDTLKNAESNSLRMHTSSDPETLDRVFSKLSRRSKVL